MKKGQLTLLVIIGVILLFTVSFMLYISRVTYSDRLQSQARDAVSEYIEANSINQYVTSCLDRVAVEGLRLLATQGGVIYDFQNGLTPTDLEDPTRIGVEYFPTSIDGEQYYISYALLPVSQNYCLSYFPQAEVSDFFTQEDLGKYPVDRLSFSQFGSRFLSPQDKGCAYSQTTKNLRKSGYLGYSKFPLLCTDITDNTYDSIYFGDVVCPEHLQESNPLDITIEHPSVERQLEYYIKENMNVCFDESFYEERGDDITVDIDLSNVTLQFIDPSGILLQSTFPFSVSLKGEAPIIEFVDFQQSIDLNFLDTYNFIYTLTTEMAKNPGFNFKEEDYKNIEQFENFKNIYKSSFEIELLEGGCELCSPYDWALDDVLRVRDTDTSLRGEPYDFYVALKQRKPVLDYLNNPDQDFFLPGGLEIDYIFYEGETIELTPQAIDPNYDNYEIMFRGWKETHDEILDLECCRDDSCNLNNYDQCLITTAAYPNLDFDCCRDNYPDLCNKEILATGTTFCSQVNQYQPKKWSTSFSSNNGKTDYVVQATDVGLHTVTVSVTDEHGATDFQNVRMLVYDAPLAQLDPDNSYPDVDNTYASIEDPYTLYADQSQASVFSSDDAVSYFVYRIPQENLEVKTDSSSYVLPNEPHTLSSILPLIFRDSLFYELLSDDSLVSQVNLEVSLTVEQEVLGDLITSPESKSEIIVAECLPHGFFNPTSGFAFNSLLHYDLSAYEEDGSPYYSAYQERPSNYDLLSPEEQQEIDNQLFLLPHACCVPQIIPISQDENTQLPGGYFADTTELCYQNQDYQTCYPPESETLAQDRLLKSPSLVTESGEVIAYTTQDHEQLYGGLDLRPAGADPYQVVSGHHLGDAINDIFEVTHHQYCSGNRGNVCGGQIEVLWNEVESCQDLDQVAGQFARCQGPGLPENADEIDLDDDGEADYTGGSIFTSYFGEPLPSSLAQFRCQGGDATQTFNVALGCENYDTVGIGTGTSFEKDFLFISEANDKGLTQTAKHIQSGYCAGPQRATVVDEFDIDFENGPYECFAVCSADAGGCSYERAKDCFCEYGDSVCDGLTAQHLFKDDFENFACSGSTACSNSCQQLTTNNKESCYCQVNQGAKGVSSFQFSSFRNYFEEETSNPEWETNGVGNCCVSGSGLYVVANTPVDGAALCFDGEDRYSGERFDGGYGTNKLLSYAGQVFYCAEKNVCADTSYTSSYNGAKCLHINPHSGNPFCEERFYLENAPCCSISGMSCSDPTPYCTSNPSEACCVDGTCSEGNTQCTSVDVIDVLECDHPFTVDDLIDDAINDPYVVEVAMDGQKIGNFDCIEGQWQ